MKIFYIQSIGNFENEMKKSDNIVPKIQNNSDNIENNREIGRIL